MGSMKFLVILALAVAVSAEADPQVLYNYHQLPITSYIQKPLVTSYVQKPLVYTKPLVTSYVQKPLVYTKPVITKPVEYHAASPGVSHTVLKREAEAYYPYMHTTCVHSPSVQPLRRQDAHLLQRRHHSLRLCRQGPVRRQLCWCGPCRQA